MTAWAQTSTFKAADLRSRSALQARGRVHRIRLLRVTLNEHRCRFSILGPDEDRRRHLCFGGAAPLACQPEPGFVCSILSPIGWISRNRCRATQRSPFPLGTSLVSLAVAPPHFREFSRSVLGNTRSVAASASKAPSCGHHHSRLYSPAGRSLRALASLQLGAPLSSSFSRPESQ